MKIFKRIETYLIGYTVAGIVTFGHAYNAIESYPGEKAIGAWLSAMFWPLYVSVQAWK